MNGWLRDGGIFSYSDQFGAACKNVYERHMATWKAESLKAGATLAEWDMWMQHQRFNDHHDSLYDQVQWLETAGFRQIDAPWRYLLWTVVQAFKPCAD